jgi:hypothetical protein
MPTDPDERRRFSRFAMDRTANVEAGERTCSCRLVDISLRGALLDLCADCSPELGSTITVRIALDDEGGHLIDMLGTVAHVANSRLGIHIKELDLDSSTNLRRLVEVNLGDEQRLERELEAMLEDAARD